MSDQSHDPQDDSVRQDEAVVDEWVRVRFGVGPREDRSGLFRSEPTATPGELDEDERFEAYMRRHFSSCIRPRRHSSPAS